MQCRSDDLAAAIQAVQAERAPCARIVLAPAVGLAPPVAVFPGAFDPLTRGHAAIARAALRAGPRSLLFSIAVQTVDKEDRLRASVAQRLAVLCAFARRRRRYGVVVCNRGLYLEQAQALERLGIRAPRFVIGFDKLPQVFDPRYYADRDAALEQLFRTARLLVAARGGHDAAEVEQFMRRPEQCRYAPAVAPLRLSPAEARLAQGVSSTLVRERVARGERWEDLVPPEAARLVASGVYGLARGKAAAQPSGSPGARSR